MDLLGYLEKKGAMSKSIQKIAKDISFVVKKSVTKKQTSYNLPTCELRIGLEKDSSCTNARFTWINSTGRSFNMCERHLNIMQSAVEDYEQVNETTFRVVRP